MVKDGGDAAQDATSRSLQIGWVFTFAAAAYNLVRMRNLTRQFPPHKSGEKCVLSFQKHAFAASIPYVGPCAK